MHTPGTPAAAGTMEPEPAQESPDAPEGLGAMDSGEELPGELVEIFPYDSDGIGLIGVPADDVLNLREGPGTDFAVVAELEPLTVDIAATGQNRSLDDDSFWSEIVVDDASGWVNTRYLAYLGQVTEITTELEELPTASTIAAAAEAVVHQWTEGRAPSTTVITVDGPTEGDPAQVVLDAIGYGDDALAGERFTVTVVTAKDGYTVQRVQTTLLCMRGLSEGLCL